MPKVQSHRVQALIGEVNECLTFKREPMAKKVTGKKAASAASKVLRDGRTSRSSKTAAGSALSQREKPRRRKK